MSLGVTEGLLRRLEGAASPLGCVPALGRAWPWPQDRPLASGSRGAHQVPCSPETRSASVLLELCGRSWFIWVFFS